jgi:hypothetical protein
MSTSTEKVEKKVSAATQRAKDKLDAILNHPGRYDSSREFKCPQTASLADGYTDGDGDT